MDLISEEALELILHIAQQANYHNSEPLIMVSPTPVFGFELAEKLQGYLAHLSGPSSLAKASFVFTGWAYLLLFNAIDNNVACI